MQNALRKGEVSGTGRSAKEEDRSSPGSPDPEEDPAQLPTAGDATVGEEVVELRAAEDEDDCVIQQATPPSFSASNPSV